VLQEKELYSNYIEVQKSKILAPLMLTNIIKHQSSN